MSKGKSPPERPVEDEAASIPHAEREERQEATADDRHITTVDEWLARAKNMALQSTDRARDAVEAITRAQELDPTLTERRIAERVGQSKTWVHDMLKWRDGGYAGFPFDRSKRAAAGQPADHEGTDDDSAEDEIKSNGIDGDTKKMAKAVAKAVGAALDIVLLTPDQLAEGADSESLVKMKAALPKLLELINAAIAIRVATMQEVAAA